MSPQEIESLTNSLEAAHAVAGKARSVERALFWQWIRLRDVPEEAPAEFRQLLSVLKEIPDLEFFDNADQYMFHSRMRIDRRFLVLWLLSRAQATSVQTALADLARYLNTQELEILEILHVDGIDPTDALQVGELTVVPWHTIPNEEVKWELISRRDFSFWHPTAAIMRRHTIPRCHLRAWDAYPPYKPVDIQPMLDMLRCCTAVLGAGFRLMHRTLAADASVPWVPEISGFGIDGSAWSPSVPVDAENWGRVSVCFERFAALADSAKERFRIPLDRLNSSVLKGFRTVDAAIELGIALESLYGPIAENEKIAKTIRNRAKAALGTSAKHKGELGTLVTQVYDLRSRAVHTGRFDADEAGAASWADHGVVRSTLEAGQRLVGQTLEKFILSGEPDWSN
ncbi:MAG: hypothetical protein ACRCV9_16735 [Burkholderiaceae bacterium]